jgi:hypothetical protein
MAEDDKKKGAAAAGKATDTRTESARKADVRAVSQTEVRVDASDKMSYKDYAAQFTKPVVTIQRIIDRKGLPRPEKGKLWPNMAIKQVVKWGELPKEEAKKPDRVAATITSHIIHAAPPRKPPPPGIGSMEPGKG